MPYGVTGPVAPNGRPLGSAGLRIGARLIDGVIGFIVALILAGVFNASGGFGSFNIGVVLAGLVVGYLLDAGLTATKGGSVGKLLLGLRVANASDGNSPVSWTTATTRWAIPGVFSIVPILGTLAAVVVVIVSLVFLFSDKLRQTVWDKVAKTLVVTK